MTNTAEDGIPLADVISAIKRELQIYEKATNDGQDLGLELTDVDVTLAVQNVRKADGGITFGISLWGIGGKVGGAADATADNLSTLSVKLSPPKQSVVMADENFAHLELASTLIEARAQLLAGLSEKPALPPSALTLELKFVITKGAGPKAEFSFSIISGKLDGRVTQANTHTVKLTFKEAVDL